MSCVISDTGCKTCLYIPSTEDVEATGSFWTIAAKECIKPPLNGCRPGLSRRSVAWSSHLSAGFPGFFFFLLEFRCVTSSGRRLLGNVLGVCLRRGRLQHRHTRACIQEIQDFVPPATFCTRMLTIGSFSG